MFAPVLPTGGSQLMVSAFSTLNLTAFMRPTSVGDPAAARSISSACTASSRL